MRESSHRALLVVALGVVACGAEKPAATPAAAEVENPVGEATLSTITLSEDAEQKLGIALEALSTRSMTPTRLLPGEMLAVPGNTQLLTSPGAGRILPPEGGAIPLPGMRPKQGEALLRILPIAPDGDLMRAGEDLQVAELRLRQAELEAERAATLWRDRLISARDREAAEANLGVAQAAREAAAGRAQQAAGSTGGGTAQGVSALVVRSPFDGVLQRLLVGNGQIVTAGSPLLEVSRIGELWVRVPLYVGDMSLVDAQAVASVRPLGATVATSLRVGTPVPSPGTANAASASADLYYRVRNEDRSLRPGSRVEVSVPLRGAATVSAVPWSAVLFDAQGGTWVYESTGAHRYTRRRVRIGTVSDGWVEVRSGLAAGAKVVTDGAAELFGVEFGAGK